MLDKCTRNESKVSYIFITQERILLQEKGDAALEWTGDGLLFTGSDSDNNIFKGK